MTHLSNRHWSRRDLGKLSVGLASLIAAPSVARSASQYVLKMSVFAPPANGSTQVLQRWADSLDKASSGELTIQVFPSSQMGPPPRQFDLARTGVADLAWVLHSFTPGRFPLTEVSYLPGLFPDAKHGTRALQTVSSSLVSEHAGTRILALVASPTLKILTNKPQISSVADFKGKRLRHPGAAVGETLAALGATPVAVPPAEMGEALSKGVVDGIVTTYEAAASFKLLESVKYSTDINVGIATLAFVMNDLRYRKLPNPLKQLIDQHSGLLLSERLADNFDQSEVRAFASVKDHMSRVAISDAEHKMVRAAYASITKARLDALEKRGLPARNVYDRLRAASA